MQNFEQQEATLQQGFNNLGTQLVELSKEKLRLENQLRDTNTKIEITTKGLMEIEHQSAMLASQRQQAAQQAPATQGQPMTKKLAEAIANAQKKKG